MRLNLRRSTYWFACATFVAMCSVGSAQINIIHQEGFNDDGDGSRYVMTSRGALTDPADAPDGPGAWEHSFLIDEIGLPSTAPARRAAILWSDEPIEDDFTDTSLAVWDNLIGYMLDGKENATIGFLPNSTTNNADFLSIRLEDAGHTIEDIDAALPPAGELDLVIHTAAGNPPSPTDLVDYPVPVITYNAQNHDDTSVSSIGTPTTAGPEKITILDVDHPVLEGIAAGEVQWIDPFLAESPLQGIGISQPGGATTLATYVDPATEVELPALTVIEEGANLLGAFAPTPEGEGFIIGGGLDYDFGEGVPSADNPVTLTLNPVDISGETGVKLAVDLAATNVDFEAVDLLRVAIGSGDGEFTTLAEFNGMAPGVLTNPDLGDLSPDEFREFVFDVPDDIDNLTVRFEAFSTFPNEVLGIDNVRIFTGEELEVPSLPGDIDGDGMVAFSDFLILSTNFGMAGGPADGDVDGDGQIAFADFLTLSTNFGMSAAASSVPEPSSLGLLGVACLSLLATRRRRV